MDNILRKYKFLKFIQGKKYSKKQKGKQRVVKQLLNEYVSRGLCDWFAQISNALQSALEQSKRIKYF